MRSSLKALLAALLLAVVGSPANAAIYTLSTAEHPSASNLTLEIIVPALSASVALGPLAVTGTANADISLDVSDTGTMQVNSSAFNLSNFGPATLTLPSLGSIDVTTLGLGLSLTGGPVAVNANAFTIDSSTPGAISINQGTVVLNNPTGLIGILLPGGTTIDFSSSPSVINFSQLGTGTIAGTTDDDSGLLDSDGAEINLPIDATVELTNLSGLQVLAHLYGSIGVGSPFVVPEVSTMAMMSLASLGLAGFAGVRRLKRSV